MRKRTRQRKSWPSAQPSSPSWNVDVTDVDTLLDSINHQISQLEFISACREIYSRDGYGGLVRICDDQMFRERGFISEHIRPSQPSPPSSTAANTGPSEMDMMSEISFPAVSGEYEPGVDIISSTKIAKLSSLPNQGSSPLQKSWSSEQRTPKHALKHPAVEIPQSPGMIFTDDSLVRQSPEKHPSPTNLTTTQDTSDDNRNTRSYHDVEKWQLQLKSLRSGKFPSDQKRIRAAFIADQAYKSATTHLQNGDYEQVVQLAEIAAGACPADKLAARDKINRLKQLAIKRLQLS